MFRFLFLTLMIAMTGCSSAPTRDIGPCSQIDWWEAGRTDGVAGLPIEQALAETAKRCEGRPINLDEFNNGHEAGLIDFESSERLRALEAAQSKPTPAIL